MTMSLEQDPQLTSDLVLNRIAWLDNIGRSNRSHKNEKLENFLTELQRLTIVHESERGPESFRFASGAHNAQDTQERATPAKKDDKNKDSEGWSKGGKGKDKEENTPKTAPATAAATGANTPVPKRDAEAEASSTSSTAASSGDASKPSPNDGDRGINVAPPTVARSPEYQQYHYQQQQQQRQQQPQQSQQPQYQQQQQPQQPQYQQQQAPRMAAPADTGAATGGAGGYDNVRYQTGGGLNGFELGPEVHEDERRY